MNHGNISHGIYAVLSDLSGLSPGADLVERRRLTSIGILSVEIRRSRVCQDAQDFGGHFELCHKITEDEFEMFIEEEIFEKRLFLLLTLLHMLIVQDHLVLELL